MRFVLARRVAWDAYLHAADVLGLLDADLIERPRSVIADAFRPDQDFIAHARQDVPRLLEEVRQLRSLLAEE